MAKTQRPIERWASRGYGQGDGLHSDLFTASCFLIEEGQDDPTILSFLKAATSGVGDRHVPERELVSAINYARAKLAGGRISERWPEIEHTFRNEVIRQFPANLDTLMLGEETLPQRPDAYLPYLYHPQDLVCVAASSSAFNTLPLDQVCEITRTHALEFINPSPMSARTGITIEGKTSTHCEANTGPRVYLVTEFDVGTPYEQACVIKFLATRLPLVMVVYSGGKSIHGWFLTEGRPENYVRLFFEDAVRLGADTVTWSRCQFCRMPAGFNQKRQKQQSVLFFRNPKRSTHTR